MIDASGNIIITKGDSFVFATTDGNGNAYVNVMSPENSQNYEINVNGVRRSPDGEYYAMWVSSHERGEGIGISLMKELISAVDSLGGSFVLVTSAEESIGFYRNLAKHGFQVQEKFEKGKTKFMITR